MQLRGKSWRARLMFSAALGALVIGGGSANAEESRTITIAPQSLASALYEFGGQTGRQVMFTPDVTAAKITSGVTAAADEQTALAQLLQGTGLTFRREANVFVIVQAGEGGSDPQSAGAVGDGAEVDALIVTAQKREEDIQDVPIAISAFTQEALDEQKIEGGFDLLKAIPNVTFSKNNFSSYNFSIRGIGTKAVSVTTDPGVAVAFNSTALIRNRLFEQEYFDIERVEVLRGPQGTLYGRNATAGVINVISAKPDLDAFSGFIKGEVGNYQSKRLTAMVNVPLAHDKLALRLAGALTEREGYDFNETTGNAVNGRDLSSTRLTLGFQPMKALRADLIWERFEEDDNRSRTGKQLCHRDPGPENLGAQENLHVISRGMLSQGCKAGSLYDDAAFGTPNGLSIPFILAGANGLGLSFVGYPEPPAYPDGSLNFDILNNQLSAIAPIDPYGDMMQSRDLRNINSILDPRYRAKTDVVELNIDYDITPSLRISSQTAYVEDQIYSFQDYNRFNTVPIFNDSSNAWIYEMDPDTWLSTNVPSPLRPLTAGGVYCDPQIGCSRSIAGFDISQAKSTQFSQELRLQSDFSGPFNFSVGANYTQYKTLEDYYVMFNLITLLVQEYGLLGVFNGSVDPTMCMSKTAIDFNAPLVPLGSPESAGCIYIDPNPIESINGDGHNYFRSKNPYRLKSAAAFGEVYWEISDALKLTAGLRYTDDKKTFTPVPTQVLLSTYILNGGTVDLGYPALPDIKQHWGEFSGRVGLDWKPDLAITDDTLLYAFYSRGYKGGGANPPGIGFSDTELCEGCGRILQGIAYPRTYLPEFVNAFEVGAKNVLWDGGLVLNAAGFYYDYRDYQVSQIKDRTAVNENFDADVWGLELEALWNISRDFRINGSLGYQDSKIAKGEQSLDLMDRTQGNEDWIVVKPFPQLASNCVAPRSKAEEIIAGNRLWGSPWEYSGLLQICPGWFLSDPGDRSSWPNGGEGFLADLSGNELPNAPHWTVSMGAQYGWEFIEGWRATVRGDAYWQSQSWARVYNAVNDKLHGWYNVNLSLWIERPEDDLKIELYAKNLLDKTPITDAFLNSDDTALTTNVFVLDPRLIGLSIRKGF